jgi:hypothetical protein
MVSYQQKNSASWISVPCSFTNLKPNCTIGALNPLYVPIPLNFWLTIISVWQTSNITIPMNSHYYRQLINIISVSPYVTDTYNASIIPPTVVFTTDLNLNPQFSFICDRTGPIMSNLPASILSGPQFTCLLTSADLDQTTFISLFLNTSQQTLSLPTSFYSNFIASGGFNMTASAGVLEFVTLRVQSPFMVSTLNSQFSIVYNSNIMPYSVPSIYRDRTMSIKLQDPKKNNVNLLAAALAWSCDF